MSLVDIIRILAIGLSIVVVLVGAVLLFPGSSRWFEQAVDVGALPDIDFQSLQRVDKPNDYLVCPDGLCQAARADETANIYDVPMTKLRAIVLEYVDSDPNIDTYRLDLNRQQFDFVERSRSMRFPDVVTVRFFDVDGQRSTLAIYSRSIYGYSDLGANQRRVKRWLSIIEPSG